jgi:hypothetical protein
MLQIFIQQVGAEVVFFNGFEEGTLANPPWKGSVFTGTTLKVQNSTVDGGSYALQVSGLRAQNEVGYAYTPIAGTEFTASAWYRFNGSLPTAKGAYWALTPRFAATTGPDFIIAAPIYNFGTSKFGIRYFGPNSSIIIVYQNGTTPISANVWYRLTVYIKSSDKGILTLWVGTEQKLTVNTDTNTRTIGYVCSGADYIATAEPADRTIIVDSICVTRGLWIPNAQQLKIFSDKTCTKENSSIGWGKLSPSSKETVVLYVRNDMGVPVTLSMANANWTPSAASTYIAVSWNYTGQKVMPGEVMTLTLYLTVSSCISNIKNFSFKTTIYCIG